MRPLNVIIAALAVLPVATANIGGLTACAQQCYGNLVSKGASLGCPSGDDACLCASQMFQDGVHDCISGLCPSQDPSVSVTEEVNKVKTYCSTLNSQSATSTSPSTSQVPAQSGTPSGTNTAGSSATPSHDLSGGSAPEQASPGLAIAAKVGIAVGASAAAIAAVLAVFLFMRRRNRRMVGNKISDPLPGSGRYRHDAPTPPPLTAREAEKYASELETKSRRYEDMVPRQQPRQLV